MKIRSHFFVFGGEPNVFFYVFAENVVRTTFLSANLRKTLEIWRNGGQKRAIGGVKMGVWRSENRGLAEQKTGGGGKIIAPPDVPPVDSMRKPVGKAIFFLPPVGSIKKDPFDNADEDDRFVAKTTGWPSPTAQLELHLFPCFFRIGGFGEY